ncbi:agmatinase [Patescibacteria group bacterium]|nr:agmatinase [Patescibacteria group bacterium]
MQTAKNNLFDLPKEFSSPKSSGVIVVPFGFEATTCYGKGTKNGPDAIIKASAHVELFDEELWQETYKKINIFTLPEIKTSKSVEVAKKQIGETVKKILLDKKVPIVLGGEHSITPFIIEEYKKHFDDFSILQFDAHADLRNEYLDQKYSHACAMRRCLDFPGINLVQAGIRSIANEEDELNFWQENRCRIKTFWAKDKKSWKTDEIIGALKEKVYVTFDVDAFDSGLMPSTGTPEPGGLDWYETLDILRAVCAKRQIIGADFVELSPIKNLSAPDFLVAKLIYKTIGYIFTE